MKLNLPTYSFRTYSFCWSQAWFLILLGSALMFMPERFERHFNPLLEFYLGMGLMILGVISYGLLLFNLNRFTNLIKNFSHILTGVWLTVLGLIWLFGGQTANFSGWLLMSVAAITISVPFVKSGGKGKLSFDLAVINLAVIGLILGLTILLAPMGTMFNFESLLVEMIYIRLFGLTTLVSAGLLLIIEFKTVTRFSRLLIHLMAILSLSLIILPSLLSPWLTGIEFLAVFLFARCLILFWDSSIIRENLNSMHTQLLGILIGAAFVLIFFSVIITGNFDIKPFSAVLYSFVAAITASVSTSIINRPLMSLRKGVEQILRKSEFRQIQLEGPTEIGQLTKEFNQMALEIQNSRSGLEKEIEMRTKELRQSKENITQLLSRMRAVLESTEEPLAAVDKEGKILIFNAAASRLTGYSAREATGKSPLKLLKLADNEMRVIPPNLSPVIRALRELKTITTNEEVGYFLTTKKGEHLPVIITSSPIYGPQRRVLGAMCVFKDISVQKRLRELQNEFVFVAAHELRNPVAAIAGYVEMAQEVNSKSTKINTALRAIEEANSNLTKLINNLLQIARFESGKLKPKLKNVKLSAVLNKVLKEQGRKLKNANINLEQFVNKDLDILPVRGDEYFVYEILSNLVSNAIKYTTAGNIKISADLGYTKGEIQGRGGKARYAVVKVEDTGIGIPRDEQGKVFNKFFRASNAGGKFSGNGLGLFIVRELVEKMDGKIWFESMEGKGSKFGFSLPLVNH